MNKINQIYDKDFTLDKSYKKINTTTLNELEENKIINIENDYCIITGYWVVKNNQKNNEGHYINLLKEFIKNLNNKLIYFHYDDNYIKEMVQKYNNSKIESLRNKIEFIKISLEELDTFNICRESISNFMKQDLEIANDNNKYDKYEKGRNHYNRDFKIDYNDSNTCTNNYNIEAYVKMLTIWTSKLFLIRNIIEQNNHKYYNWLDISINRCEDKFREESDFMNMPIQLNKINLFHSEMKYLNKSIKYSCGCILGDKDTFIKLIDLFNIKLIECFNENYFHDEETIIDRIRLQEPNLFSLIY